MSLQDVKSASGDNLHGFPDMNILPPHASQLSLSMNYFGGREFIGSATVIAPLERHKKPRSFHPGEEGRGTKWTVDGTVGGFNSETDEVALEQVEDDQVGERKNGHTKLCARGHWRPQEDAKLKNACSSIWPSKLEFDC